MIKFFLRAEQHRRIQDHERIERPDRKHLQRYGQGSCNRRPHCRRDQDETPACFDQIAVEAISAYLRRYHPFGLTEEVSVFLEEAEPVLNKIPVLGVLGNHDFESGNQDALWKQLSDAGLIMLDGNSLEIYELVLQESKGSERFRAAGPQAMGRNGHKNFVRETGMETQKLEAGLSRLPPGPRIVAMHYARFVTLWLVNR